ncbi:MAG: FAD-binding oxidoreductase [Gammaproteobacteria bacterium]
MLTPEPAEKVDASPIYNYYTATAPNNFTAPQLQGDISVDTVIIGGGYAGLATAMSLLERGHNNVALLEAERIGFGASGRNGGFVFGGFSLGEKQLVRQLGVNTGRWAYRLTTRAIERIRARATQHHILCDLNPGGVILANWFNETRSIQAQHAFMRQTLDVNWDWLDRAQIRDAIHSTRYHNGLFEKNAFHFHPLKYARGLAVTLAAQGVRLFEHTPALSLSPLKHSRAHIITPQGTVTARHVVVACGGYIKNFYPPIARSILPISTYVMVTEPLGDRLHALIPTEAAIYDTRFAFDYYRKLPDHRLLWGGRISIKQRNPEVIRTLLMRDLLNVFPDLHDVHIDYAWGGLMAYVRHQMPIIGKTRDNIWHVIGFGGHGVGPTTAGGELIAQAICGENTDYTRLARYTPRLAFGYLGQMASQLMYWQRQTVDWINEKRFNRAS